MTVTSNGSRNRQAAFRERMVKAGLVQVSAWVHSHQEADVLNYLRHLRENPGLSPGPLRDPATGRLVRAR